MPQPKKGILPGRTLAIVYFGLFGVGIIFFVLGIVQIEVCHFPGSSTLDPVGWCRWPSLFFGYPVLVLVAMGLAIVDSFARGHFDD